MLHEDAEYELLGVEEAVNSSYRDSLGGALANAWTGRFMGFDVFMDQKVTVATSVCKNMLFHRNAMVLATRPLPPAPSGAGVVQKVLDEDGFGIRVTISYDHDYLGVKGTVDCLYGVAVLRPTHGVVLSTSEK